MLLNPHRKALIVLVCGACIIGLAAILVRLTQTGPAAAGFWRLAFALPMLAVLTRRERRRVSRTASPPARSSRKVLVFAGVMFAADLVCWHYSLHLTSVANSTVLANMTPVVITLAGWLLFKERPARLFLLGLALAVGGTAAMAMAHHGGGQGSNPPLGDLLAIVTTCWYGAYFMAVREARKTAGAFTVMLWSSAIGAPLMLVAAYLLGEPILPAAAVGWLACIGLGVVHVTGQGAVAWALGKLPAALTAIIVLVQPIVVGALGWLVLGESVSWLQGLGAAIALAGICVAQWSSRTPRVPAAVDGAQLA
jgi:drug/metabolite transporter (DMT)-like permease